MQDPEEAIKQFTGTIERWHHEGRVTQSDLEHMDSPEFQEKMNRLIYEDMGRTIKLVRREETAERLGFKYGCGIIMGVIVIVVMLLNKGC